MGASRFLKFLMLVISSLTFAAGHLAYGPVWAGMLLIYVPFLSYRYGKKYGLGTVMVCHVLYDLFTYGAARLFV
jgi:membrane protease YdiL (CAAX protease family)